MSTPTLLVEIDVTSADVLADPATFTWTPITARVRADSPITIERGANMELGRIEPGRCVLTLSNRDRAFDPLYTSSPYNGFVTPMRPFRVSATWPTSGGTTYRLFTGFTERFTPQWGEGGSRDHTVQLEAVDALDYLARAPLGLEPLLTWTTVDLNETNDLFYDISGGRRLLVRLRDAPAGPVDVQTRGALYPSGSFTNETLTLTTDNYLTGVTGTLGYTSLTRLRALGDYSAGVTIEVALMPSFVAERSDVQVGWALDLAGWPVAARALQAGQTTCTAWEADVAGDSYRVSDVVGDGDTVFSGLQRIVESEGGVLFIAGDGTVTFQSRHHRILNRASLATLGSGAGEVPVIFDRPPALDSAEIRNIVRVTPHNGATQVASDATSISRYGRRPWAKGGLLISRGEALDLANYRLARGKNPRPRTPRATIVGEAARWALMLAAEIGQAYTLRQRPPNVGSSADDLVFLEAITWQIRRGDWRVTWAFSEDPGAFWVLGDATQGQLGVTTIAGY